MICAALLLYINFSSNPVFSNEEAALKAALAQAESAHPANLQRVDDALVGLAQFLQQRGRYREAEPLFVRSNDLNQEAHGSNSEAAARSLLRLGTVYHAELRFDEAERTTRQAAGILKTVAGPESLDYACAMANLGAVLADKGENARAEPVLRSALYVIRKNVPANDPMVPSLEANLGLIYLRQGEFRKAEPLLRGVLAAFEATGNPAQASTLAALAELSIAERRWLEADTRIRQAYRLTVSLQGDNHPLLVGILHLRALVEAQLGDARSAAGDMKRSIDLLEALAGPESRTLATLLDDYGLFLRQLGRKTEAKAALRRAKSIRQEIRNSNRAYTSKRSLCPIRHNSLRRFYDSRPQPFGAAML